MIEEHCKQGNIALTLSAIIMRLTGKIPNMYGAFLDLKSYNPWLRIQLPLNFFYTCISVVFLQ